MMQRASAFRCGCAALLLALVNVAAAGAPDAPVADAAKAADWALVRALLDKGADAAAPQGDGGTALHWASYWDQPEIADLLIQAGADVDVANDLGVTPIWVAGQNGSSAMVETLLGAGANPDATLPSGETPLMTAARTGNADVVERLLAAGATVNAATEEGPYGNQTALMWAVGQQHSAVARVLLAHGADVAARSSTFTERVKTVSPAYSRYGEQCIPIYECNTRDVMAGGFTPLLFAARVGDLASLELLVAAGADVNDVVADGASALVIAAQSGHEAVAAFLLEEGADPNSAEAGHTALHSAILRRDTRLVGDLLAAGADPNAQVMAPTRIRRHSVDYHFPPWFVGATAFWLAARHREADMMRLLAEHGADPLFVHNPQYWSTERDRRLIEEGETTALMAAVGLGGRDPFWAVEDAARIAENGRIGRPDPEEIDRMVLEAVKVAVELGVDMDVVNASGQTALEAARAARPVPYQSTVEFLESTPNR